MSMASAGDAFAFKNSGLNAFLFAEVGTEQNGSPLTVLSVLARLNKDPWAQAAEWAQMPNAITIDRLTNSIVQMPLCSRALAEARVTSGRIVMLLPRGTGTIRQVTEFKLPEWTPLAIFCVIVGLAIAAGTFAAPTTPAPVTQTVGGGDKPVIRSPAAGTPELSRNP
jgi:hypothetical protein